MKKLFALLFTLGLLVLCTAALAEIDIDGTFPDPKFNAYVRSSIDRDHDGVLSNREVLDVREMYINGYGIKEMNLAPFSELEQLQCSNNPLTALDLSSNKKLESAGCWSISTLTSIKVPSGGALKSLSCEDCPSLTSLDVSKCKTLERLNCCDCGLTTLTIGTLPNLTELYCTGNKLKKLDVSKVPNLVELSCNNNKLSALDVTALKKLIYLSCGINPLKQIDVSRNTALKGLDCNKTQLSKLDVSGNTALVALICTNNNLSSLDLSKSKNLQGLWCSGNKIKAVDISKCSKKMTALMSKEPWIDDGKVVGLGSVSIDAPGLLIDLKTEVTYKGGVFNRKVTGITLSKSTVTLTRTAENPQPVKTLKVKKITPADARIKDVTWTSSNPEVASVDANGKVTALKNGTATITCKATDGTGVKATCKFTVESIKVSEITLNKTSVTLTRKAEDLKPTVQLKATAILPEDAAYRKVKWTSDNPEVAEVDGTGKVTALKNGTAVITCKASDGSGTKATCKITVKSIKVSEITLNKTGVTLTRTADDLKPTVQLEAVSILPENAAYPKVKWTSDKPEVASVDAKTGLVTGLKYGTAIITCKASDGSGVTATCKVSVSNRRVSDLTLNENNVTLTRTSEKPKPTVQLSVASIEPADAASKNVKWSSDKPEIAKVDANGKVTALKAGTAVITCKSTDGGASATCKVVVKYRKVTGITLNKTSASIKVGKTLQLKVTEITPADAMVKDVTWESSNTKIATVDKNGKVTAVKAGTCEITCTSKDGGKFKVTCKITVK